VTLINLCQAEADLAKVCRSLNEVAEAKGLRAQAKKRRATMRNDRQNRVEKLKERVDGMLLRLAE
jgi:hypothetical protein